MSQHKLFQNATLITFNPSTASLEVLHNHSLLIKDDRVVKIAPSIAPPENAEIIDGTNKIISPGFINTHTHMWQAAYRSAGPNVTLHDYFLRYGQFSPSVQHFSAEDVYVGTLEGYLESLNAGTTTCVEHAHANWDVGAVRRAYDAAVESGSRVWWCCAAEDREGCAKGEAAGVMGKVRDRNEGKDALVRLGYAWDNFGDAAGDEAKMKEEKEFMSDLKVEAITVHYLGGPWKLGMKSIAAAQESPAKLQDLNIPIVFSHGGFATEKDIEALRSNDWNLSITPESEYHFGHGQATSHHVLDQASLGIDGSWSYSGDMLTQARMFLQHVRANEYQRILDEGKAPRQPPMTAEDAFLLLTRQGGLALRRPDLGVLAEGAKADLAILDTGSPNMAGWTNAVAAVVMHANASDVEGVLVDGQWRKKGGKLVGLDWNEFRGRFEEVARRVQGTIVAKKAEDQAGDGPFGGLLKWGESKVFSTRRT